MPKASTTSPFDSGETSFLVDETKGMNRLRRLEEQQGLRALLQAKVNERARADTDELTGDEPGEGLEKHPLLDGQALDGLDNNPPDPRLNPEARREFDNKKRDQERRKGEELQDKLQLSQKLQYSPGSTPRFHPKPGGP
jgi:hypothetical protein